jgi:hypothetical protein
MDGFHPGGKKVQLALGKHLESQVEVFEPFARGQLVPQHDPQLMSPPVNLDGAEHLHVEV